MHAVALAVKRAHLRTVINLGRCARRFGITPARYDLLYAIWWHHVQYQRDLWSMLDVSRATVSRMVIALEKLGLVRRGPHRGRASRTIALTAEGRDVIEEAFRGCHRPLCLLYESLYPGVRTRLGRAREVNELRGEVAWLAADFGDRSRLFYQCNAPEDVYPFVPDPDPWDEHWPTKPGRSAAA